ncbi:MAG TPA: PAS domain S-box protein, partial [Aggregatilineales bacterium]|nr:PAS domain S-box protein [Aggregatilineales bacterium]
MLTVYFISRRGHFQAGIRLGAYVASLAIVMIHVNSVNSGIENNTLFFLVVIIIINSIIDSIWQTMLLFVAQMLALLVLILIYEEITLLGLVDPIILLMMVSILVMIYAWIRNQIEGRRSTTLMEQEQNYRVIFNTSDHIVMIHDGHQVVLCNDAAAKLCGYTDADELIGKSFRDFIHPDDFEMVATRARARLDPNALTPPNHYEMRVLRVDGITHWVDSHSTVIQFGGKRMTMANAIDITERKKAEDALHHRLAFDKIVTGISTRFANLPVEDIDRGIEGALDRIGRFLQASHACIYLYHPDEPYVYNSHEWTAADVKPYRVEQPYLPVGSIPWSMGLIREFQNATVSNLNELSNEVERSLLQSFSVKSFIKVPIVYQSTLLGFLSVDSVTEAREWSEAPTPEMLRIVGEIFATTLERKQRDQKLRQYTFLLETLTILGGIISSTLELTPLMEQIANLVVESLHVSSVHVIELDSDQRTMTVIADYFDPGLYPGQIHTSEPHKPYTLP